MNSEVQEQRELERLLSELLGSPLDQAKSARLERLLRGHPERIRFYRDFMELDVLLEAEAAVAFGEDISFAGPTSDRSNLPDASDGGQRGTGRNQIVPTRDYPATESGDGASWLVRLVAQVASPQAARAAAVLIIVTVCCAVGFLRRGTPEFIVTSVEQASWHDPQFKVDVGDALPTSKDLSFASGRLYLETASGAKVAIEGPAKLRPLPGDELRLALGKARVRVSQPLDGFVVHGPDVKITDLGTEFGVEVDEEGQVDTEVYEGRVLVDLPERRDIASVKLSEGWAGRAKADQQGKKIRVFPIGREAKSISWSDAGQNLLSTVLANRPEFYHRLDAITQGAAQSLVNKSLYSASLSGDAELIPSGPRDSLGGQGHALSFSGNGAAEISIGMAAVEQTGAYTFSLWVRVDRLADQNILVATNHLGPNAAFGPQLRMRSDGSLEHYLYSKAYPRDTKTYPRGRRGIHHRQRSTQSLAPGRWYHVAIVASTKGEMLLLIDGEQAAEPIRLSSLVSGENLRVLLGPESGRRFDVEHHADALAGAVDELAFFNRSLTEEQVAAIYDASRSCFREVSQ